MPETIITEDISLKDYLIIIGRNWGFLVGMVVLGAAVGYLYFNRHNEKSYETSMPIQFTFHGIENNRSIDGGTFSAESIISPQVLQVVAEKLKPELPDISASTLRADLLIAPFIPSNVQKRMAEANKKGQEVTFHPDRYNLSMKIANPKSYAPKLREKILLNTFQAYLDKTKKKYKSLQLLAHIDVASLDQYDYVDEIAALEDYLDASINTLTSLQETKKTGKIIRRLVNPSVARKLMDEQKNEGLVEMEEAELLKVNPIASYVASGGTSLPQLINEFNFLKSYELENAKALVTRRLETKNPQELAEKYRYSIALLKKKRDVDLGEAASAETLLKEVLVRGKEPKGGRVTGEMAGSMNLDADALKTLVANDYYNYLLRKKLNAEVRAKQNEVEIADLQNRVDSLSKMEKNRKQSAQTDGVLKRIIGNTSLLTEKTNRFYTTYLNDRLNGVAIALRPPSSYIVSGKPGKTVGAFALAGLLIGILGIFFLHYWRRVKATI